MPTDSETTTALTITGRSPEVFRIPKDERANVVTHLVGTVLCLVGTLALVAQAADHGALGKIPSLLVYGLTLALSYAASVLFHAAEGATRSAFRTFDRRAIYFAIAGFYTPILLHGVPAPAGLSLLLVLWILACAGSIEEGRPGTHGERTSVALYGLMAWSCLAVSEPLAASLTPAGYQWLLAGCLVYSLGALVLFVPLVPRRHEVWHVLALLGSVCQYVVLYAHLP